MGSKQAASRPFASHNKLYTIYLHAISSVDSVIIRFITFITFIISIVMEMSNLQFLLDS